MEVAVVLVVALTVVLICFGISTGVRWRRTPQELRGDWWNRFEREFRDYASRTPLGSEWTSHSHWTGPERRRHPR